MKRVLVTLPLLAALAALALWPASTSLLWAENSLPSAAPAPGADARRDKATTRPAAPVSNEVRNLTPEQVEEFLSILHEQNPKLEARIRALMVDYPEKVNAIISQHWGRVKPLIDLKRHDPEMFDLSMQEIKLTRQCEDLAVSLRRNLDPGMGDQNKAQLKDLLAQRFEVRQKMRELRVARLEKQLLDTRARMEQQVQDMKANIQAQVQGRDKALQDELKAVMAAAAQQPATKPPKKDPPRGPDTRPAEHAKTN
jgi:hypothetical protein